MRDLKFHYVGGKNVLCFGPQGIAFYFKDYGRIVQIKGRNFDSPGTDDDPASNGAGKSSIFDLISLGLYGKPVKNPKQFKGDKIINKLAGEKGKGEIDVRWDNYRVLRTFKANGNKLQIWESKDFIWDEHTEISKGEGSPAVQATIQEKLGLSHQAFCNVLIFDDKNAYSFLESDTPTKREIIENLLQLDIFRQYHKNAKDILKAHKEKIAALTKEYQTFDTEVATCISRLDKIRDQDRIWRSTKETEIATLRNRIKVKQTELQSTDSGEQLLNWQKAQNRISDLTNSNVELESKRDKLTEALTNVRLKADTIRQSKVEINSTIQDRMLEAKSFQKEMNDALALIAKIEKLDFGTKCPICYGIIDPNNSQPARNHATNVAESSKAKVQKLADAVVIEKDKLQKKNDTIAAIDEKISEANSRVALIEDELRKHRDEIRRLSSIQKPDGTTIEKVLEAEVVELTQQLQTRTAELEKASPYVEIINSTQDELKAATDNKDLKDIEVKTAEADTPYHEYWVAAYGDNGIRKYVVDGNIPPLNARIAYWLQVLTDGVLDVKFDAKLDEVITRKGTPADFCGMSNGECRKINLGTSQAFSYVMMLNSGTCPSVIFLDEITGGGMDRSSVVGVYNMIFELAKERQVFITTHNPILLEMLEGTDTIWLEKRNDITTLAA